MSRKMKKFIVSTLIVSALCTFVAGCGSSDNSNETTGNTTAEVTTTEEPTTPEETTEEPSTEYVFKGEQFAVSSTKKALFMDLVVEKGYKIALNDIVGENEGTDGERGCVGLDLTIALYFKNHVDKADEFAYNYWEDGADSLEISYDKNVIIEYNEEEKMYFHFVKEENGYAYFDVYEID